MLMTPSKSAAVFFATTCVALVYWAGCSASQSSTRGAILTPAVAKTPSAPRLVQVRPPVAPSAQAPLKLDIWPRNEEPQRSAAQSYSAARSKCSEPVAGQVDELSTLLCSDETNMAAVEALVQTLAKVPQQRDVILHAIACRLANLRDLDALNRWEQQHRAVAPAIADLVVALQVEADNSATAKRLHQALEAWNPASGESKLGCARTVRTSIIDAAAQPISYTQVNGIAGGLFANCEYARRIYCETKMHGDAPNFSDLRQRCAEFANDTQLNEVLFRVAYQRWQRNQAVLNSGIERGQTPSSRCHIRKLSC